MNAAQRNRQTALLQATGYEDEPPLTAQSTDGDIPQGRELSFAWLAGTVMTGLTSVVLMGAALYVSFSGQDTFSTAYEALQVVSTGPENTSSLVEKTNRLKPVAQTRSEKEIVEASIRENVDGRGLIRKQPFVRVRATLATSATALSGDIPVFDPVALLNSTRQEETDTFVSTDIYGAEVEGEVAVQTVDLPMNASPQGVISDKSAAEFVKLIIGGYFPENETAALSYASLDTGVRELNASQSDGFTAFAENVTVMPKTRFAEEGGGYGRSERILTIREPTRLRDVLIKNGFTEQMIDATTSKLGTISADVMLPVGTRLRILFGPIPTSDTLAPYRMSIYVADEHRLTVALTDRGQYVVGSPPPAIEFTEEDTEEINVNNLPSIYRSIWETARKHDVPDSITKRIVTMFAYDLDLTKRIAPGDSLEILQTPPNTSSQQELLHVSIKLGNVVRQLYRFRSEDGVVDYYDSDGETGKRFLQRRPLKGGGNLRSRFGNRRHPVYKTYRLHAGIDLAAPRGTPIYASGDGVVKRAQWVSGYGRFVELTHRNGYGTRYGHMSKIAAGMAPGVKVRQGDVIGYVGTTGVSTGNHLHFEIRINGRPVDPLSIKLPRSRSLPPQSRRQFADTVAQMNELMQRDPAPVTVASAQ